ncbi:MAG: hypothetical protein OEV86_13035 [Candidatus Krumholzibacteria bacterium]|nr:hypothetical protein [Candidatus Krumholzibacteria bacterium]
MSEKLKPCPFCGGEAYDFGDGFACCKDEWPWMLDGVALVELWNTRPREERLEKALREIASQPPHTMDCAGIARRALEGTDEE